MKNSFVFRAALFNVALLCAVVMSACATKAPPSNLPPPLEAPAAQAPIQTAPSKENAATKTPAKKKISPGVQGRLRDARLNEISGLAHSQRLPNRLWAINDSGNRAEIFALDTQANLLDVYRIAVSNRDWEAMAATTIAGVPYLLVADTGDNLARHDESRIHFIVEPDKNTGSKQPLIPAFTLRFQYPDGPHNVEAMAVSERNILLVTKERLQKQAATQRSQIYQLPINGDFINRNQQLPVAQLVGSLTLPKRSLDIGFLTKLLNVDPLQPTDLVISDDNHQAYILNYVQVLHYSRRNNESWVDAFANPPTILYRHGLRQAEALTVSPDGVIWLTSERAGSPLVAINGVQPSSASRVSP